MNEQQKSLAEKRSNTKTQLSTIKWTTTIGAVSLTLAGWGLLAQTEALNAAKVDLSSPVALAPAIAGPLAVSSQNTAGIEPGAITAAVTASATQAAPALLLPTPTPSPAATATVAPTATPTRLYTLDIVQWVESNGEQWAVVRDARGVFWYVWEPDVKRIEQGLEPQQQPQPVNATGRSRGS